MCGNDMCIHGNLQGVLSSVVSKPKAGYRANNSMDPYFLPVPQGARGVQ